ncbi:sensor histidine kinase [Allokutzneria multivorans]|uniref:sensor histidine kinase n=1 Tax=Allokutzneria multivorans TaxID=1142134 RepID=UPI0031EBB98B
MLPIGELDRYGGASRKSWGGWTLGPAERELRRLGLRYAGVVRTVVIATCSVLSLLAVSPDAVPVTLAVAVGLNAWNAVYVRLPRGPVVIAADAVVLAGVCLAQPWVVQGEALYNGTSWVLVVVSIVVVTHQWHVRALVSAPVTVFLVAAYLLGAALAAPTRWPEALPLALWMLVEAALSYGLYMFVRRGGRRTDRATAAQELARRQSAIASAVRADERVHLANLHDTAAATLLMVGAGVLDGHATWLAEQAARDLDVLSGSGLPSTTAGDVDLVRLLEDVIEQSPLRVDWRGTAGLAVPAVVAVAVCRATREALNNVARHSGVLNALVRVSSRRNGGVVVEVLDSGCGFEPEHVPPQRRGLTHSLVERLKAVGGRAVIASSPGAGTSVRLEWPRA